MKHKHVIAMLEVKFGQFHYVAFVAGTIDVWMQEI
jgi:hypothetical protein